MSAPSDVLIIGASAAGLAAAACLKEAGIDSVTLLEKSEVIAPRWRQHYDRLHLHTDKRNSGLPHLPFPQDTPKYPPREQVVGYLENYAEHFGLQPEFGRWVTRLYYRDGIWRAVTSHGDYEALFTVVATGYAEQPVAPRWPGQERYRGLVMHSANYNNGAAFKGKDVLVVGFGNSGGEIAIDLHEHGARPGIAVRSPVNVIPRDLLGIPILTWSHYLGKLPSRLADLLAAPLLAASVGDIEQYGLRKLPYGPLTQVARDKRIPLLDIGTMALIKEGALEVLPGVAEFTADGVIFTDGAQRKFDAVVLATGYKPALEFLGDGFDAVLDGDGAPLVSGKETALPGLFFCGFYVSPRGMLREIAIEAPQISKDIVAQLAVSD